MRTRDFRGAVVTLGFVALCGLGLKLAAMPIQAELPMQVAPDQPANPDDAQDNTSGVYVRDSAIAQEKIAQAKRMQDLKEWNKSADLYQEILEKYPDRVVSSGTDANTHKIVQYQSVTEQVRQAICHWPIEGLEVYRSRYETTAAGLLKSARPRELENLHKILALYFATDTAKTAALRLMDTYFEFGDYAAVQQIGQRMLDWHPNLLAERPGMLFRVALADQLCGNLAAAGHLLDELKAKFANATGQVRGSDVVLAEALDAQLKSDTRLVRGAADDFWPMIGGDPSRSKISSATGKPGAKLYDIKLLSRLTPKPQQSTSQHDSGDLLGVMPVVDHDDLFFQDNAYLYAVSLESGAPLPGWLATYPTTNGIYKLPHTGGTIPSTSQLLCVTVTEQNVVALMELPGNDAMAVNMAQIQVVNSDVPMRSSGPARLVCLDRASGKERWNVSIRDVPEKFSNLREISLNGSPLVVGENVYIAAHGVKGGAQFEDCYVLCFSLRDGTLRWVSYVASSAAAGPMFMPGMGMMPPAHEAVSHLAYAGGSIFVSTELGAVASLDAFSGSILWLDIYREENVQQGYNQFMGGMMPNPGNLGVGAAHAADGPYVDNPVIVQDGHVFTMPSDGKGVYVYDAASGTPLVKTISAQDVVAPSKDVDDNPPKILLGVMDDDMLVSSVSRMFRIPWRTFASIKDSPDPCWASAGYKPKHSDDPKSADDNALRGRPFITTTTAYIPTSQSLNITDLRKGVAEPDYPANGWDPDEQGPGNVLVSQNHVIIAGDMRVDVYTDLAMATRKLDKAVTDAPSDPTPRLRYAEVMFAAGQVDVAKTKLLEAVQFQGGPEAMAAGLVRDRTFADALTFANRLIVLGKEKADAAKISWFFDQAAHAAQTPSQNVSYRSAWAKFAVGNRDLDRAVELYQSILGDDQMRVSPLADAAGNVAQAGVVAEKAIDDIKAKAEGVTAYQKYEQMAAAKLTQARAAADAAAMLAVARAFPNADCRHAALTEAADLFEKNNDPRHALMVLRQILLRYPKSAQLVTLQAMARNYLKLPNGVDAAVGRLAQAVHSSPDAPDKPIAQPLTLPDGSQLAGVTLKEAHMRLLAYAAKLTSDALPDLNLPSYQEWKDGGEKATPFLPERPETILNNIDALIAPMPEYDRHDRFVTYTAGGGVAVYQPGQIRPLGVWPEITAKPNGCAWYGEHRDSLAVWTDAGLAMLDTATGKTHWSIPTATLQPIDAVADRDDNSAAVVGPQPGAMLIRRPGRIVINGNVRGHFVVNNGGVVIVNGRVINAGGVAPVEATPPASNGEVIDHVVALAQSIILTTSTGRVMAVDAGDGTVTWQTRVSSHCIDRLLANDDFVALRVKSNESGALIALNTDSGDLVGRQKYSLGDPNGIVNNLTLGSDGSLVYVTTGQLHVVDLFDAHRGDQGLADRVASKPAPNNPTVFMACVEPGALLVHQGRIYAVADDGAEVRVYNLEDAEPVHDISSAYPDTKRVPVLATGAKATTAVKLRIVGSYLHVQSASAFAAYNLQNPSLNWHTTLELNLAGQVCGKNHLLLLDKPQIRLTEAASDLPASLTIQCHNRSVSTTSNGETKEMGLQQFSRMTLNGAVEILPIDGGIVYRTQDRQIHTLMGAAGTLPPK